MKISILGAGAFGTALGGILASNGYDVDYYDPKLEREVLSENIEPARYIILAMPSSAVPYILPHLPQYKPLIITTKGILSDKDLKVFHNYMVLSGPGFAADIKAGKQVKLTATDAQIGELFSTDNLTFDYTTDRLGVLMCGALKNVYAIYAGYLGLERDSNDWRDYIRLAAQEMKQILQANGADPKTVDLSCGVPDLMLTAGHPSRNYGFGVSLRKDPNYQPDNTVEGISAIKRICRNEIALPSNLQILPRVIDVVSLKEQNAA